MKHWTWKILLMAAGVAAMASCTPPVEREPEPPSTPTPTPPITPHPAVGAQARAVQLYPDLAVKDSLFNKTFLEVVQQHKDQSPMFLTRVDWPLSVAAEAGRILGVRPTDEKVVRTTPLPTPQVIYVTPRPGSSLERGAYNRDRGVTSTPIIRYYRTYP